MDDWLGRGGPFGAMLAFGIGGVLLLPVGYVYGEWVKRLPDAAGEAAYTAEVFPPIVSYFTGWIMLLAYFIVCPWEAVAVGKLAGYLIPSLNSIELYRIEVQPVFLPRLLLGVLLTLFLGVLNYRGIRGSATFKAGPAAVLVLFAIVAFGSGPRPVRNAIGFLDAARPTLLVLQIVPYFMTGFESVPKRREAHRISFARILSRDCAGALLALHFMSRDCGRFLRRHGKACWAHLLPRIRTGHGNAGRCTSS
jgi:amino acid transporter